MRSIVVLLVMLLIARCVPAQDAGERQSIAAGKVVTYAPKPNYGLTAKGDTDATDLTDGKLTTRENQAIWFDAGCVGWSYGGRCNLSVDLEQVQAVDEVTIRMLGGWRLPLWAELLVSDDGQTYYKVDEYSVFNPGDREKFAIPRHEQENFVFPLTFRNLQTRARHVGFRMYMTGLSCAEELYVYAGDHDPATVAFTDEQQTDFTVTGATPYFHKPVLYFSTNVNTPNSIGLIKAEGVTAETGTCIVDLPGGLDFVGGSIGGTKLTEVQTSQVEGYTRYEFPVELKGDSKVFGRVYLTGDWAEGRTGALRYQLKWAGGESPLTLQPVEAIVIPDAPQPERLMTTLSWWGLAATKEWPGAIEAFRTIGFNTASTFARHMSQDDAELWAFRDEIAAAGFKMLNIDSPIHVMMSSHKDDPEWKCQLADGKVSTRLCPSYRGPYWEEELQRVAAENARLKPDYWFPDIEVWNWQGPVDAEKCTRCQADFARSGCATWEEWKLQKGYEMWTALATAARDAVKTAGGPEVILGVYDWTPQHDYQFTWPFMRMYPEYLQTSQPSTYTPLYPYHIALAGDEARADAVKLGRNVVMPWLTPGDAGMFSGEAFYRALLEQFFNGAIGTNFWSSRVWDSEILQGYARAVKVVAPVEDIIADGTVVADKLNSDSDLLRLSGIEHEGDLIFLLGNYYEDDLGTVRVRLPLEPGSYEIIDLASGEIIAKLDRPPYVLTLQWGTRGIGAFWARQTAVG